jgi:hypothetical protein
MCAQCVRAAACIGYACMLRAEWLHTDEGDALATHAAESEGCAYAIHARSKCTAMTAVRYMTDDYALRAI